MAARAKVNLHLEVVGRRRSDGYHELRTLFQALELHDDVRFTKAAAAGGCTVGGFTIAVEADIPDGLVGDTAGTARIARERAGGNVPNDADNVVLRAARAWCDASVVAGAQDVGGRFELRKRIPTQGGLGGGSADAAVALHLLQAAYPTQRKSPSTLQQIAASLGADVAFFLRGGTQWGTGTGAVLQPVTWPDLHFVLLVPGFGCSTPAVFENSGAQWIDGPPPASVGPTAFDGRSTFSAPQCESLGNDVPEILRNDLEQAAFGLHPELARLATEAERLVRASGASVAGRPSVQLSGSGSTLFFVSREAAKADAVAHAWAETWSAGASRPVIVRTRSFPLDGDQPQRVSPGDQGPRGSQESRDGSH